MSRGCRPARWGLVVVVGLGVLSLAGCGSKQPVRGKLVFDSGEPVSQLDGFDVTFTSEKLGVSARGTIQSDGTFQLGTDKDKDGAPPGEYIVTLTQPHREPDRPFRGDRVVDLSYEDPRTSDLRAEVTSGKNYFVFKLRRYNKSQGTEPGHRKAVAD